jgi:general secretion pathway protein M
MAALFEKLRGSSKATPVTPLKLGQSPERKKGSKAAGPFVALVLLLLAIAAIVALIAIPAYLLHQRYDEEIAKRNDSIVRYQRKAQERVELQEKLDAVSVLNSRRLFLKETSIALAQPEVQNALNMIISANSGRIAASSAPTPKADGRYKLVLAQIQFYAKITDLRKMLIAIDAAEPHLFVDNLTIRSLQVTSAKPVPGFEPEHYITIDVGGYMIEPEAVKPANTTVGTRTLSSSRTQTPAKADAKVDAKSDAKADSKVDAKSEVKGDVKSVPATKVDPKSEPGKDMKTDSKSSTKSEPAKKP